MEIVVKILLRIDRLLVNNNLSVSIENLDLKARRFE